MHYAVKIYPVLRHQNAIVKLILKILGPNEVRKAKDLATKGGIITKNLNKEAAGYLANQLRDLGAQVEVEEMIKNDSGPINENFQVKLTHAGRSISAMVKLIKEITGLGHKESNDLLDNLGVVANNLSQKEAVRIKERLERNGAKVEIVQTSLPKPEPEPELEPKTFGVAGVVTDAQNEPLSDMKVAIFYGKSNNEKSLGEVNTNSNGQYSKIFNEEEFLIDELERAGSYVIIRVFDNDQLIGESPAMKIKGRSDITINLSIELIKEDDQEKDSNNTSQIKMIFDGEVSHIVLETKSGKRLRIEEINNSLFLEDQNGNKITLSQNGVHIV